jgi:transcription antiterminator licT
MKIRKFLNNNAAVVTDEKGKEKVITGKGVIHGKKVGDEVEQGRVEKIFYLSSNALNLKFQEILSDLPLTEINIIEEIVSEIQMNLGKRISDVIYVALADHIHFALKNFQKGISIKNGLMFDIMRFYPDEYKLGCASLAIIQKRTGILLPPDEAGFIALHIVNAETEDDPDTQNICRATKIIEEILEVVKDYFAVEIEEDSLAYFRFINHLRYFSGRLVKGAAFSGDDKDRELLETLSLKYQDAYKCGKNIEAFILKKYGIDIGCEELLYLTIHIQRAVF